MAVASGLSWLQAAIWAAWSIGYMSSVIAVHRVIARHRRAASSIDRVLATSMTAITIANGVLAASVPIAAIALPLVATATCLVIVPPRANRLRAIGVILVIASLASGSIAIAVG